MRKIPLILPPPTRTIRPPVPSTRRTRPAPAAPMAVSLLYRSPAATVAAGASAQTTQSSPPTPTVRRSARLVPHTTPQPPAASSSKPPIKSKASRPTAASRKRPREVEAHTSQTESESESDGGRPARPSAGPASSLYVRAQQPQPPLAPAATPRSLRAQKRQRLSGGGDGDHKQLCHMPPVAVAGPSSIVDAEKNLGATAPSVPPLGNALVAPASGSSGVASSSRATGSPKTRAAKRKSLEAELPSADNQLCAPLLKKQRTRLLAAVAPVNTVCPFISFTTLFCSLFLLFPGLPARTLFFFLLISAIGVV